jgi:hypothetical protein
METWIQETTHVEKGKNDEDFVNFSWRNRFHSQFHSIDKHVGAESKLN